MFFQRFSNVLKVNLTCVCGHPDVVAAQGPDLDGPASKPRLSVLHHALSQVQPNGRDDQEQHSVFRWGLRFVELYFLLGFHCFVIFGRSGKSLVLMPPSGCSGSHTHIYNIHYTYYNYYFYHLIIIYSYSYYTVITLVCVQVQT